jgi:glycosyltransferase involved in cell wall biosynthesis
MSRKPRIAHVINSVGLGGVPEAAFHLLRCLPRGRYDCALYVLRRAADEQEAREGRLARFEEIGVRVSFPERDDQKMVVVADLCRWLGAQGIDLVHTHSYKPNLYGRLAALLRRQEGLKMIAHYHNQYDNKWESDGGLVYDEMLARSSDGLIACSESVRDHVAQRIGVPTERIDVVLNGVEAQRFAGVDRARARAQFDLPPDRPVVAIVGRISEQKGQEEFIRAAAIVRHEFPQALFLVVGSADEATLLGRARSLVSELGLTDAVRFTGHVTDMPALYAAIDLLAAPSRWEGFGLMLVEAMAAGKPIVATAVGAIPEVVVEDRTALLVPPRDP